MLDVSPTTLRHWADEGLFRVYRTPGGHRRFHMEDVKAFTDRTSSTTQAETVATLEDSALRLIRRRLHQDNVARQAWYQSVEEEGRARMRLFGRRLLSILAQEPQWRRKRAEMLEESYILGKEYGSEMTQRGVPLKHTVEAFIFFRSLVLDSASHRSWSRILELADRVLVGLMESYEPPSATRQQGSEVATPLGGRQ